MDLLVLHIAIVVIGLITFSRLFVWYARYRQGKLDGFSARVKRWRLLRVAGAAIIMVGLVVCFIPAFLAPGTVFVAIVAPIIGLLAYSVGTLMEIFHSPDSQ